jgi:hypothetical protein
MGGRGGFRGYRKLLVFENGSDTFLYRGQFFLWGNCNTFRINNFNYLKKKKLRNQIIRFKYL